jgi:class 3 adenylate cyclase
MGMLTDITKEVEEIFKTSWQNREGTKVPEAEDVKLGNDAVTLEGTALYADLAQSTLLVNSFDDWFAAEIYKSYLVSACRIIRNNGGEITAFDGDRVMAVYIGDDKNTSAARSALQINYIVQQVINPKLKVAYPESNYTVRQSVGIDTSKLFVARTGIRGSNDLVWVGRAANYAAKMCSLRDSNYTSFITADVFNRLNESLKSSGNPTRSMWDQLEWNQQAITLYRSTWWWQPPE